MVKIDMEMPKSCMYCRFVGKSTTTEMNLLDNYEANLRIEKENFKKRYGYER